MGDGFPNPGTGSGPISIGGSGVTTLGGVIQTLNNAGVQRNILDDGAGNLSIPGALSAVISNLGAINITSGHRAMVLNSIASVNTTQTLSNTNFIVLATAGAGGITLTLPTQPIGTVMIIKRVDSGAGTITILPGTGTIEGAASIALPTLNDSVILLFDGTNWWVLGAVAAGII